MVRRCASAATIVSVQRCGEHAARQVASTFSLKGVCRRTHTLHVLLELTELAKPVERPCLCCNTHCMHGTPESRSAVTRLNVLLEFTELAKPVEMPRLCCNTHLDVHW